MKKNENDLISVIVPIYNVEKYLKKCVDSILKQSYTNLEVILVDDGSPDSCGKICEEYKKNDQRVKVIHKENGGLSAARNKGIDIATGKYITFIDSDDYVENDYIEYLYYLVRTYNTNISFCGHNVVYENKLNRFCNGENDECWDKLQTFEDILYSRNFEVSAWGKLYLTSLFKDIRYPKGRIFEDIDTTYKLIDQCEKIAVGFKSKYNYIMRKDSITNYEFSEKQLDMIDATENMCNYLKKYSSLDKACKRRITYSYFSTLNRMINSSNRDIKRENEFRKNILKNKSVLFDKKSSTRDKIGIITIVFGIEFYRKIWNIYQIKTGRK